MISVDAIKGNETLKGLTEEQMVAIATMSEKDENEVIGRRFGEVYRQLDATILASTGIERNGDEKTYNYLERATKEFGAKYADYDAIKEKVGNLETELAEARKGADQASKAKIASLEKELGEVRGQYSALQTEKDNLIANHKAEMVNFRVDGEIAKAKEGVAFKKEYAESALNALVGQAIANVKKNNPSFEEREGKEVLIFHDAEGAPMLNSENGAKPYTAKELLIKEFTALGILETKPQGGAGGKGGGASVTFNASTQVEADEKIKKELAAQGITITHKDYNEKFRSLREQYKVSELPLK